MWTPEQREGIAGVKAPAFIERSRASARTTTAAPRIAGVKAPAFIERWT